MGFSPLKTRLVPAGHTGSRYSQWESRQMRSFALLLLEHQSETLCSPGTHHHFPTEKVQFRAEWRTSGEHIVVPCRCTRKKQTNVYLFWSLLFGDLLRIEELGHIDKEGRHSLGKVNHGDFIGHELLLGLSLSQGCLLRLTQPDGCTHHTGILLKIHTILSYFNNWHIFIVTL